MAVDEDSMPAAKTGFGTVFAFIYALALLPPAYIALSRGHQVVAGIPAPMWYLILTSLAGIATVVALYTFENRKQVLD